MVGTKGQAQALLKHLKSGKGLTSKEAFESYGITRLSGHIHRFRKAGFDIISVDRVGKTRYGTACNYVEYFLKEN